MLTPQDKINKCIYNWILYKRNKRITSLYYKRCYPIKFRYQFMRKTFKKINPNQKKRLLIIYYNIKSDNLVSDFNKFINYMQDDEIKQVGW